MAELLAVVGSVGAIINIIDGVSKIISVIHSLQHQWHDADLAVLSLASQLSAFRAALRRIQEWLDSEVPAAHHQLIMDLDETLSFCNVLVLHTEALSVGWEHLLEDPKSIASRWKVTFGNKSLDNILVMVERQTNALTLLLSACNCQSMSDQKRFLERPRSRRVLRSAKADSESLLVHQDTTSFKSRLTDNLSKMSMVFDFDPAVFSSGVYHRVFRGSLKYRLRQQQRRPYTRDQSDDAESNDGSDDLTEVRTRDTTSTFTAQIPLYLPRSNSWMPAHQQSLEIVQACETHMLEDCDRFAAYYVELLAKLDTEHALNYSDDQAGQITRRISQSHIVWKDFMFQQLLTGGSTRSATGGPNMTLCRFFAHQMQALGNDRFQHQLSSCLSTLNLAYETASIHRANRPKHLNQPSSSTDYSVHTAWSRTTPSTMTDALTIIVSVPLSEHHYELCNHPAIHEDLALALQPLMYDIKYCSPSKFTFILLLHDTEHFIERLSTMCFPIAPSSRRYYLNVVLAEIVRLFRQSNEETESDYITLWDSPQLTERIMGAVDTVATKGQVTVENGVSRAKLLPVR
ncbi:hypothetical protein DE146DRAFT_250965 [Phaeosphaeria sp. MPI-PUGE-AT-0046c]|nr:hypothetical protein DE146DRAFT_250965 [Phaeosphaeria sp. MPI-PUGE-AT-0046c]